MQIFYYTQHERVAHSHDFLYAQTCTYTFNDDWLLTRLFDDSVILNHLIKMAKINA